MWIIYGLIPQDRIAYVGLCKTERYERRMSEHRLDNTVECKDFSAVVLLENISTLGAALEKEKAFVALYDTFHNGYNKTSGGGRKTEVSDETRAKQSERQKENWKNTEYRQKTTKSIGEAFKEMWKDPDFRNRMSEIHKELWKNPERRKKYSEAMQAHYTDPEYREKFSDITSELWKNPEYRNKVLEGLKAYYADPKNREKRSEIYNNPERCEKLSRALKAHYADPGNRERLSENAKEKWQDPDYREAHTGDNHWKRKQQREKEEHLAALIDYEINDAREKQRRRDMRKKQVADTSKGTQLDFDF